MQGIVIILGVMLFLWSTAVVSTGFAMLISDGRLGRREWYKFVAGVVVCLGLLLAYLSFGKPEVRPSLPLKETAPAVP